MMNDTRILYTLFITLGALVFCYVWSALYFMVLGFDYNRALPWSALEVYWRFGAEADYQEKFLISLALTSTAFIGLGLLWFVSKPKNYFGDARWATKSEIKKAQLLEDKGLLLGKLGNEYVRSNEPVHALVTAPTRSGKGVGIVIPNLLSWSDSALILDIKQENFEITSGLRGQHQKVFMFSPADENGRSHKWNPLDTIRDDKIHRTADIQKLATILLPAERGESSMWVEEARDLFIALTLYVLDTSDIPSTIGEIYRTLKTQHNLADVLDHILKTNKDKLDPACIMGFNNFLHKAPKEQSGVKSTLSAVLNLWSIPSIDAATSASDFKIEDIRRAQTTIYFGAGLNQLKPLSRLIRLFFELSVDVLTRKMPGEDEPYNVLMMIDEFGSLGKMPVIANNMAFVAGYNLRIVNIIQGLAQLDDLYGKPARENILQNSALQIFYASNDDTTTHYVTRRLGDKTTQTESISYGNNTIFGTKSQSYTKTEFMKPEDFRRLCKKHAVMFKEGTRPVKAKKIIYHQNKDFTDRLMPKIEVPALKIEQKRPPNFDIPDSPKPITKEEIDKRHNDLSDDLGI
jgi:type IV secretion system protein VirD4